MPLGLGEPLRAVAAAVAFVVALLSSACESAPEYEDAPPIVASPDDYHTWALLAQGDIVRIEVYNHPEMSTPAEGDRVDPAGVLHLPMLGGISVLGLTVEEAREKIQRVASSYVREPRVGITVLQFGARDFYLLGHIDAPGPYRIDRPLSALQALSMGGKILPGAARETCYLLRPGEDGFAVRRFDATKPDVDGMVGVRPNDLVFVPRSGHGHFAEEILPYIQGIGFLAAVPVAFRALD